MKLGRDEKRTPFVCWDKDAQAQSLRVELADGSFFVFPYTRLHFVCFEPGADQDKLHLVLDTQEVRITGKALRDLGIAFQKFAVECVRVLPARYAGTTNHDDAFVASIRVSEIQGLS
jgi:hypothetical protein